MWNVPDTLVPRSGKLYQQDLCASYWQKCLTYFMSVSVFSSAAEVGVLTPCSDANKTLAQREEIAHPLSAVGNCGAKILHSIRWIPESRLCSSVGMETSLSEQGSGG